MVCCVPSADYSSISLYLDGAPSKPIATLGHCYWLSTSDTKHPNLQIYFSSILTQLFSCISFFLLVPGGRSGEISNSISTKNLWNLFENRPFFDKTKTPKRNIFAKTYSKETLLCGAKIGKLLIDFEKALDIQSPSRMKNFVVIFKPKV